MRAFQSNDQYVIIGRGLMYAMTQPDPVLELGEVVNIDGCIGAILGIERFMSINGGDPGHPIGVLLDTNAGFEGR